MKSKKNTNYLVNCLVDKFAASMGATTTNLPWEIGLKFCAAELMFGLVEFEY